jgi:hypothetical protein
MRPARLAAVTLNVTVDKSLPVPTMLYDDVEVPTVVK